MEGAGLPEQRWPPLVCQEQEEGLQGWEALLWILCSGSQKQGWKEAQVGACASVLSSVGPSYCQPSTYGLTPHCIACDL